MNAKRDREIYTPSRSYSINVPGGTTVARWEIVGRRVYVEHTDGLALHSELTPGELRLMVKRGEAVKP